MILKSHLFHLGIEPSVLCQSIYPTADVESLKYICSCPISKGQVENEVTFMHMMTRSNTKSVQGDFERHRPRPSKPGTKNN